MDEIDIPLTEEEKKDKIELLKRTPFKNFKIHAYYNRNSYLKHGVELKEIEEIYPKFDKIIGVFKRPAKKGYKYSFIYKLEETKYLYLCFFLDESPPQFFNAYYDYTNLQPRLKRKVEEWLKRESNKRR